MISDVTGDAPTDIASGPCAADPSTYADAIAVLSRWNVEAPDRCGGWLQRGANGDVDETPKPGDPLFEPGRKSRDCHRASIARGRGRSLSFAGIDAVVLGDTVTGEAREVAKVYAALVREIRARNHRSSRRSR